MNIKTYFDKTNTIVYNSTYNTSQNPVCELYYGDGYTRVLLYIDTDRIKSMIDDCTFPDTTNLIHILKMKNAWNLQALNSKNVLNSGKNTIKERTSSFDLYLLRMPEPWDSGSGNDFTKDGFVTKNYSVSENGSNWFNSATENPWTEVNGVISEITTGNTISTQHFDIGNEDISFDITTEVNNIISGTTPNNGFMICFPSLLEQTSTTLAQYVGFFTNKTTTFFKPYLETLYVDAIIDDRNEFYLDKVNRLYFYSLIGGSLTNLDSFPTCSINNTGYTVTQATKGVYYVECSFSSLTTQPDEMLYDVWSNIIYNDVSFPSVELEFVTKSSSDYFNFGNESYNQDKYVPTVYGIKYGEKINRGQTIKIFIAPRVEYTTNVVNHITGIEYRIYVKEINKEITVIDYQAVNRTHNSNYFTIFTDDLLPNEYYVDIRISRYNEELIHKEKLKFEIVNEL